MVFVTGEVAAAATGATIAEIDQAAASGAVEAKYVGWQLRVEVPAGSPDHPDTRPDPEPKRKRRPRKK